MPKLSTLTSAGKYNLSQKSSSPRHWTKKRCRVVDVYYRNSDDEVVTVATEPMTHIEASLFVEKLEKGAYNVAGWIVRYAGGDRHTSAREVTFPSQARYADVVRSVVDDS